MKAQATKTAYYFGQLTVNNFHGYTGINFKKLNQNSIYEPEKKIN
jgi:hypothetical protein